MPRITTAARAALNFAALIAFAAPPAANAAAPAHPIARPPGSNPYQLAPQTDVTVAYQFRTRILVSPPSCARFATDADNIFLSSTLDDNTKTQQLKAVNAATAAAGCLGP